MERPNAWLTYSDADMQDLENCGKEISSFLKCRKDRT